MGTGAVQPQSYSKMPRDLLCLPELWAPLTVLPRPRHLRQLKRGGQGRAQEEGGAGGTACVCPSMGTRWQGTDVRTFLNRVTAVARSSCSTHPITCVLTQPGQSVLRALLGPS